MTRLSSQVKIVELSSSEVFRDKFMDNMYFKGE